METQETPQQIQARHSQIRREYFQNQDADPAERSLTLQKEFQICSLFDTDYQGAALILGCFNRIKERTTVSHYPAAVDLALKIALAKIPA